MNNDNYKNFIVGGFAGGISRSITSPLEVIKVLQQNYPNTYGKQGIMRILKDKEDRRFNEWKFSFPLFLRTWTLQGMWIFLTSIAAITAISTRKIVAPDIFLFVGGFLWLFGFLFETISDFQKRKFKSKNKDGTRF